MLSLSFRIFANLFSRFAYVSLHRRCVCRISHIFRKSSEHRWSCTQCRTGHGSGWSCRCSSCHVVEGRMESQRSNKNTLVGLGGTFTKGRLRNIMVACDCSIVSAKDSGSVFKHTRTLVPAVYIHRFDTILHPSILIPQWSFRCCDDEA